MANATVPASSVTKPLEEQRRAVELFHLNQGLRIDAFAGTGKTTTLRLLAESTSARGLYLAFNRSIAAEAGARFPTSVRCATAHSIAFRGVVRGLHYPEWKMTDPLTARSIVEAFRLPATISFISGLALDRQTYGGILHKAIAELSPKLRGRPRRPPY